jgi:uncharacterized protein YneF (UPF0154 family)
MIVLLLIVLAVGGFFAYKKFGPKKEVKQAPPASKTIKSTSTKVGGGGSGPAVKSDDGLIHPRGDSEYYKQNRL